MTGTIKRTYFIAVEVDEDAGYDLHDFHADAKFALAREVKVYASPGDLTRGYGHGHYADESVDDPEWGELVEQVRAALPGDPQELRATQRYLESRVFGSWASVHRIKRLANGSAANVPGGAATARYRGRPAIPTLPIASKDQLRLLLAALRRRTA